MNYSALIGPSMVIAPRGLLWRKFVHVRVIFAGTGDDFATENDGIIVYVKLYEYVYRE